PRDAHDEQPRDEHDEQPRDADDEQPRDAHDEQPRDEQATGEQDEHPTNEHDEQPCNDHDEQPRDEPPTSDHNEQGQSGVDNTGIPEPSIVKRGWPAWVKDSYARLTECDYGPDFSRAIGWWTTLERAYQWKSSPSGLGAQGRPPAVRDWLQ
ncbi:hypothetical protein K466DRAFT_605144, partial [Polyporus arcularius HHB13444]